MHKRAALLILALLAALVAALALGSVLEDSATDDEPAHIATGLVKIRHGRLDFFRNQPPLMNSITAAPLVLAGYELPPWWTGTQNPWPIGRAVLYDSGYDARRVLFLARLPTIALFLALSITVYLFVAHCSGSRVWGIVAFLLIAFCPTVMAHGRLATVDLAVTAFCFIAGALLIRLMEKPSALTAIALGVATACALLSKTSGNILAIFFVAAVLIALLTGRVADRPRFSRFLALGALTAVAVFEIFFWAVGSGSYFAEAFPGAPPLLVPFAEHLANIDAIRSFFLQGHYKPQFLLGEFSSRGWPHYYFVALLLKTTLPALLVVFAALVVAVRRRAFPFPAAMAMLFVALFLILSARSELAVGVRYVLPVYPFLYAASAIVLARENGRIAAVTVGALVSWHIVENLAAYPSYVSYFNQSIGSHRRADRYLIDSNLDWGQDLRRLDRWCGERGIAQIAIHYFGGGDLRRDLTVRPMGGYGPGGRPLPRGWFALSRHYYRLSFTPTVSRETYDAYLARSGARYVTTIGGSINVYRVE